MSRLDELERIHVDARGAAPGRRWGTEQLNRSFFVTLVAQFQGYCRDLHDEAIDAHVRRANPRQGAMLRYVLATGRRLDFASPRPAALGSDFQRLGFDLVPALRAQGPRVTRHLHDLDVLVDFRNAISHGREGDITAWRASGGIRATLASYRRYRRVVGDLAATLDDVVGSQLGAVLGTAWPWEAGDDERRR
jgi:hypothetical protein